MSPIEGKPKIEGQQAGKKTFRRQSNRTTTNKKEFVSTNPGIETLTFDVGHAKSAAKYQQSLEGLALHIQSTYTNGSSIAKSIRDLELVVIDVDDYPTAPDGSGPDQRQIHLWQQTVNVQVKEQRVLAENVKKAYALVMGQCSPTLTSKIKGSDKFAAASQDSDVVKLLKIIRGYCCNITDHQQSTVALESAKHRVSTFYQGAEMTTTEYVEYFTALVGVVETFGGSYGREPGLVKAELIEAGVVDEDKPTSAELEAAYATCREQYLACMLLRGADNGRYHQLKDDLSNNMSLGKDNYPKTMVETTRLLNEYKVPPRAQRVRENQEGVAFVQEGKVVDVKNVTCYHCQKKGHFRSDCPELQVAGVDDGVQNFAIDSVEEDVEIEGTNEGCALIQSPCEGAKHERDGRRGCGALLNKWHLFIDTCASYPSTPYEEILENLKKQRTALRGHTKNSGSTIMDQAGDLGDIKQMWLNECGVASVVPLKVLEKIWPISYHSARGMNAGKFVIHTNQGDIVVRNNSRGMPYLDIRELEGEVALCLLQDTIETVQSNMEGFTKREIEEAKKAREAQGMMGHPTDREFLGMVRANMLNNCNVTETAVKNANTIFGPELAGVMGRTVRRAPDPVRIEYVQIPATILERHRIVTLTVDCMFVNGVPFLVSASRGLNLITAEHTPSRTKKNLAAGITYARGGFQVGTVLMDNEFECLRNLVPIIEINTTAANEHVPEIERRIRLIKERARGVLNTLPYKKMPQLILIELIYYVVLWLNAFPMKSGVSATLSPREIVFRRKLDYAKHCKALFGSYVLTHEEPNPTNSMMARGSPGIILGPTGNEQGTYKVMNLGTGKKIKRRCWTKMPMPDSAIARVEALGVRAGRGTFDFADRNGILFEWNEEVDDRQADLIEEESVRYPSLVREFPGIALDRDLPIPSIEDELEPQGRAEDAAALNANIAPYVAAGVDGPVIIDADDDKIEIIDDDDSDDGIISVADVAPHNHGVIAQAGIDDSDDELNNDINAENNDDKSEQESDDESIENNDDVAPIEPTLDDDEVSIPGVRRSRRKNKGKTPTRFEEFNMMMAARRQKRRDARHRARKDKECRATIRDGVMFFSNDSLSDAKPIPEEDREEWVLGVALAQYSITAGLKKFKEKGEKGVTKELTQMHDMRVFTPVLKDSLNKEERSKALASLMFLKEKRDKTVKARMCADGRKQRGDWTKQESTSPTVATESVFITAVVDAHEERDVACYDIPGAFLHADSDEDITMILKGRLAELMVQVAPNLYRKYISVDRKGTAILYVKMQKAMYGLLRSALLFYRKLVAELENVGFKLNPYDPCVANKTINGKQMTVCWHVDDLKVSHVDPLEVTKFGQWLNATFGVTVAEHRGKVHDYLGMIMDFSKKGKVSINMIEYIKGMIADFPEEIVSVKTSPAQDHLFDVRDPSMARLLPEEQAMAFHHTTAQLLFLSARARRDIQPCIAFLTTRVKAPDEDDWGKVKRVLGYLKGTLHMPLILSADSLTLSRWWVDAAYAVHHDCKGHTGAGMSFGQGMAMSYSWKQKVMTKSSTEAELVGVDDTLGYILWARYFMEEQGYDMDPSLLYQDNMSAILLETNGKASSSKRTKHIKVKYFYIKEKVDNGEIEIEHCPTDQMWTDINTKPKQGAVYRKFRGHVMGIPADYNDKDYKGKVRTTPPVDSMLPIPKEPKASQECVGGNQKDVNLTNARPPESESRAPIKLVDGRPWSPNVYRNLRLIGKSLEVAWEKAFVRASHF